LVRGDSPEHPVAVTTLERYLRCPFLAFAEAGLRATRRSEDGDTIDARIRGRLLHQSLAAGMEAASRLPSNASASERQAAALNAAEIYLTSQGRSPLRRAAMQNLVADAAALIRWSAGADDPLLFLEAERAFGQAEKWGPLALEGVYVSGRIDRIDASPSRKRLRIIDYKSGGQPTRKEWHHELLQPWLYARKIAEEFGTWDVESGYLVLKSRRPRWMSGQLEDNQDLMDAAVDRARAAFQGVQAGNVLPVPLHARDCARCDARDICRRPLSAPSPDEPGSEE
jgi:hypothetical protein